MKKALLKELRDNPADYIIVDGAGFSLYLSADLETILKDYPVDGKEAYKFRMLDTGEVRTAFVYGIGKLGKAQRSRFPDTAVFLDAAPPTPSHGEKVPHFVKKSDPRKRCKGDHAMNMDEFYRTWKDRVRSSVKKFGFRDSNLVDDLEQDVYMRMIKFRIIEDCICALPLGASFPTHVFGVIRTVCLNYLRDNGRVKPCQKCAAHENCLTPGRCNKCKSCTSKKTDPKCKVCASCHEPDKYALCRQCGSRKVCVDCKVCSSCRDEKERPVRNILSQAEPLFFSGQDGEEFLHPEVSKLCDTGDVVASPLEKFLTLLQQELADKKPWTDHKGTIKSLTAVTDLFYEGYTSAEIAELMQSSKAAVCVWRGRIRKIAEEICAKHGLDIDDLYESERGRWTSQRTTRRLGRMKNG